jgi:hypothetical protein
MVAMDKRSLISKSVVVIRIDIHPAGEEPDQHVVCATPGVSRTTTICEVPTKLKLSSCSQDEVLAPAIVQPGRHHGLPHSPSKKPPQSREVQFDKVVTRLLALPGPIKPDMWLVQIKSYHQGQNDTVLN